MVLKIPTSPSKQEDDMSKEIEITPEMEQAGADVLLDLLGSDVSDHCRARAVYKAMRAISLEGASKAPASGSPSPKSN